MKYVLLMIGIVMALFGFLTILLISHTRLVGESEYSLATDIFAFVEGGVYPLVGGLALFLYAVRDWDAPRVQPPLCSRCKHLVQPGLAACLRCGEPIEEHGRYPATGGQTPNKELMRQAREALKGHWLLAIGTFAVCDYISVTADTIPYIGIFVSLILWAPLEVGASVFALALSREGEARFSQLFQGFKRFGVALGALLLGILIIVLWSLLLIIPGIIAAISYSQAFFIIADNDSVGVREALRKSQEMMRGHKWRFFCLNLRFLGWWILLLLLTCGIGLLWLRPYRMVSFARFYDDIAEERHGLVNDSITRPQHRRRKPRRSPSPQECRGR